LAIFEEEAIMASIRENSDTAVLIELLHHRFDQNPLRHSTISWSKVETCLQQKTDSIDILRQMEESGGEPDVVAWADSTDEWFFVDCSPETPTERRSLCYDEAALTARKANKPASAAS